MHNAISILLRPFAYLKIVHPVKHWFDWGIPLALTIATLAILLPWHTEIDFFGRAGVVAGVLTFVQILPGFYIAALAAIATFNKQDIDQLMPEPTPKVDLVQNGNHLTISLTRRRFLSMLFAFLTAESLVICLGSILILALHAPIAHLIASAPLLLLAKAAALAIYFLVVWQLLTATFLGLYYLGDKLHQPST